MNYLPPRYDLIPRSVQNAMVLRGDLVRCGTGVRGIAWPDNSTVRLTAIAPFLFDDRIASHLTAAWVWLAIPELPEPLHIATSPKRGHAIRFLNSRVAQLTFGKNDVTQLGSFSVTTPHRTAFDLLHSPSAQSPIEFNALQQLVTSLPDRGEALSEQVALERRPYAQLARQRIATIFAASGTSLP